MDKPGDFALALSELDASHGPLAANDVFARLSEFVGPADQSSVGRELQAELLAFAATEHWDRSSEFEFHLEPERLDDWTIEYWEGRAVECTHPFLRWRYAALAVQARAQTMRRPKNADMRKVAIDATIDMADRGWDDIRIIARLSRAYSLATGLKDSARIAAACGAIVNHEAKGAVDTLPGTWGYSFDILLTGSRKHVVGEQERQIVRALQARFDRLRASIESTTGVHVLDHAIHRLAPYYRKTSQQAALAQSLEIYADRVIQIAAGAAQTGDLMDSLRAIECLTRAARLAVDFGRRDIESRVMVQKASQQKTLPKIAPTCVGEFTIDLVGLKKQVDDLLGDGFDTACSTIVLGYLPDKDEAEAELRKQRLSFPLYSMMPLAMMDSSNRDVATAGSIESDFAGRTIRSIADGLPYRAAYLRQYFAELRSRYTDLADRVVQRIYASELFDPKYRPIIESGVGAYFSDDHIAATHLLVPQIEAAIRRLADALGRPIMWEKRRGGGTTLRMLDDLLRDETIVGVLGESLALYLRVLLTSALGWNVRNRVCHGFMPASEFDWNKSTLVLHATMVLGHVVRSRDSSPPPGDELVQQEEPPPCS